MPLDETEKMSQWSLTFEVRKRCGGSIQRCGVRSSQWSLTFEVRKRPRQAGATIKTTTRRNGA